MVNNQYNVTLLTLAQTQQMKQDSVECIELTKQCEALPSNSTLCVDAQGCWDEKLIEPFTATITTFAASATTAIRRHATTPNTCASTSTYPRCART